MQWVGIAIAVALVVAACGDSDERSQPRAGEQSSTSAHLIDARVSPVDAGPVVLDELTEWSPAAGDDVLIHAVAVDGNLLRLLLLDDGTPMLSPAVAGVVVTGRVAAGTPKAARAALFAAYPALAPAREPAFAASRSTKIDLRFARAEAVDVFRILGDVLDTNIVVVAEDLPDVSVVVKGVPVNSFTDTYAAVLGVAIERHKYAWFVRKTSDPAPAAELLNLGGPKLSINVNRAFAGEVVALVRALLDVDVDVDVNAPCDKGPRVQLGIRSAPAGTVLAAVQAVTGVGLLGETPSPCVAGLLSAAPDASMTLVAIARRGDARAALFRAGSRALIVRDGAELADGTAIRVLQHSVKVNGVELYLYPEWSDANEHSAVDDALLAGSRLAATLIVGKHRHAIVELPSGKSIVVSTIQRWDERPRAYGALERSSSGIRPGFFHIAGKSGDPAGPELKLRRR